LEQFGRRQCAVKLGELWLVVEQFQMARRPGHEQVDDALGLRREVRLLRRQRVAVGRAGGVLSAALLLQQAGQGDAAESDGAITEEPTAGDLRRVLTA